MVLTAVLACLVFLACGRPGWKPLTEPNILLVTQCSVRADRVSAYGYSRRTTPNLERLAREGVLFQNAAANASWTNASHASILSGLYASNHTLLNDGDVVPDEVMLLQEILGMYHYRTVAEIQEAGPVSIGADEGLTVGFDSVIHFPRHEDWTPDPLVAELKSGEGPYFALVHLREAHYPYGDGPPFTDTIDPRIQHWMDVGRDAAGDGDEGLAERMAVHAEFVDELGRDPELRTAFDAVYDSGVYDADNSMGELFSAFEAAHLLDNTVIVVVAGHGENLGHGGEMSHKGSLSRAVLRIPLVMRVPGLPPGQVVPDDVGQVDILPTLLELAGIPAPSGIDGRSLLGRLRGEPLSPRPVLGQMVVPGMEELLLANQVLYQEYRLYRHGVTISADRLEPDGSTVPLDPESDTTLKTMQLWLTRLTENATYGREAVEPSPEALQQMREQGYW